ncbi:MAG TPA: type II toxin-antitoxin system RelE/ParE family toxin [Chitinophagales bacterium]|nr:type II toxin-antitoxin system RelE/ParE family toxin [Chitinophagales bacterium]
MVKVVWTDSAIFDLNEIGEYISRDSERYAQITIEKLFNSVNILEVNPRLGKVIQEFNNENLREIIRLNYRIVYRVVSKFQIDILSVHRCERLLGNAYHFEDL